MNIEVIHQAARVLTEGGLVIYPTDTAMGLGCRIDSRAAIKRLNTIASRPETQPLPVLVKNIAQAKAYLKPAATDVLDLMKKYWPGGLTIVYWCRPERVLGILRGYGETLGVRMPNHSVPLRLIESLGVPIVGTSANFHGLPTPYSDAALDLDLVKKVDLVVPGSCPLHQASTVVKVTGWPWQILRQGAVSIPSRDLSG